MIASAHLGDLNPGARRHVFTPGVYVVFDNGATVGAYRNSMGRNSWQAGYTWRASANWAVSAGAVTGYPGTKTGHADEPSSKRPVPYLALSYRFGGTGLGARALWSPQRSQPLAFSAEWSSL